MGDRETIWLFRYLKWSWMQQLQNCCRSMSKGLTALMRCISLYVLVLQLYLGTPVPVLWTMSLDAVPIQLS
jgi:hypothetical protein